MACHCDDIKMLEVIKKIAKVFARLTDGLHHRGLDSFVFFLDICRPALLLLALLLTATPGNPMCNGCSPVVENELLIWVFKPRTKPNQTNEEGKARSRCCEQALRLS